MPGSPKGIAADLEHPGDGAVGEAFVMVPVAAHGAQIDRIVDTNIIVDTIGAEQIGGYGRTADAQIVVQRNGSQHQMTATADAPTEPLVLDGEWEFAAEDANTLIVSRWLTTIGFSGTAPESYAAVEVNTQGWLPMVPGAWSYQLPAGPSQPYPIDVWYRARFEAEYVPPSLNLIIDGFAGSQWKLYINGDQVTATPTRSAFDSQMQAVEIDGRVRQGVNIVAIRLTVTSATDGLLDLLKLTGDFSLERRNDSYVIAAPRRGRNKGIPSSQAAPCTAATSIFRRNSRASACSSNRS